MMEQCKPLQKHQNRKRTYSRKPDDTLKIAQLHIDSLFFEAKQAASKKPKLADRYVDLARKIAMKFKMRMPSEYKRMFCPNCYKFLIPGKNLRVRVHEHRIIYCCLECKKFWRKPVGRSRKS